MPALSTLSRCGAVLLSVACSGAAAPPRVERSIPRILGIQLLARSRQEPRDLVPVRDVWSPHDYGDTIFVRVEVAPGGPGAQDAGSVVAEIQVAAAKVVWADASEEVADLDAMRARASWLPSSRLSATPVGRARAQAGGTRILDVGVVSTDWLSEEFGVGRGLEPVRLRVRAHRSAAGAGQSSLSRPIEATIDLNAVE